MSKELSDIELAEMHNEKQIILFGHDYNFYIMPLAIFLQARKEKVNVDGWVVALPLKVNE